METLNLQLQGEIRNGRTQLGNIVAYYEQHILTETGEMDFLRVAFLEAHTVIVQLSDGSTTEEPREETINAFIEYSAKTFRCQILDGNDVVQLWDIFHGIYNQLKSNE